MKLQAKTVFCNFCPVISFLIGGNFASYTEDLSTQVTSLTLRTSICACQMSAIASHLKQVEHLDINHNRSEDSLCKKLPTLFPQLKTLRIRYAQQIFIFITITK